MAEFVTIATADGEIADVNLDMITHMRPNPADKAQVIIHFVGGHTLLVPSDRRKTIGDVTDRPWVQWGAGGALKRKITSQFDRITSGSP